MTPLELAKHTLANVPAGWSDLRITLAREVVRLSEENARVWAIHNDFLNGQYFKTQQETHQLRSQLNALKEAWENSDVQLMQRGLEELSSPFTSTSLPSLLRRIEVSKSCLDAWNRLSKAFSELGKAK